MNFLWTSSHVTNWSTNKLVKLAGSNSFGNLLYLISIIFFSTRMFRASRTVIILSRNDNYRYHNNLALQVDAFLSKLICFSFFTFSPKGLNLSIQVPTAEMHTNRSSLTYLWSLTSAQELNLIITNSTASAMICACLEFISIMDYLPFLLWTFISGLDLTPSGFANNISLIIPRIIKLIFPLGILISFRSFEMMPPFPSQGLFSVASYLF